MHICAGLELSCERLQIELLVSDCWYRIRANVIVAVTWERIRVLIIFMRIIIHSWSHRTRDWFALFCMLRFYTQSVSIINLHQYTPNKK